MTEHLRQTLLLVISHHGSGFQVNFELWSRQVFPEVELFDQW